MGTVVPHQGATVKCVVACMGKGWGSSVQSERPLGSATGVQGRELETYILKEMKEGSSATRGAEY